MPPARWRQLHNFLPKGEKMLTNLAGTSADTGDCRVGAMPLLAMTWIIRWYIKSDHYTQKENHTIRCAFLFGEIGLDRYEKLNAAQMSAAREGFTERNIYLFFTMREEKMQSNLAGSSTDKRYLNWGLITKKRPVSTGRFLYFQISSAISRTSRSVSVQPMQGSVMDLP